MPIQFFTDAERQRLNNFPSDIQYQDVVKFFTLSESDKAQIPIHSAVPNRLGFTLQLCTLRFIGFIPNDFNNAPSVVINYLSEQLEVDPKALTEYGTRFQTRTNHLLLIMGYLGYRKISNKDMDSLSFWLAERALEHDKPSLLYEMACEKLLKERIVRPSVWQLERLVSKARQEANIETMNRMEHILTDSCRELLDDLLEMDSDKGKTLMSWLRQYATSNSPKAILKNIEKINLLRQFEVNNWKIDNINPNRLKRLAQIARGVTAQALQRSPDERRYPILVSFLYQSLIDITDETIDMFDCFLSETYSRAGRELNDFRKSVAKSANEKIHLFRELANIVIDPNITDFLLRQAIYQKISPEMLQNAIEECDQIVRPIDDNYFDLLKKRYNHFRQFVPAFLSIMPFQSNLAEDPLIEAINILRQMNASHQRSIPMDANTEFVSSKWYDYVVNQEGKLSRPYYELCVLWELRNALRAGDIWLQSSRNYANPETYLISKDRWASIRPELCQQLQISEDISARLKQREAELDEMLSRVDTMLSQDNKVRIDKDNIVVSPLEADERPKSAIELEQLINQRLPRVELSELLIEVDNWTQFSQQLENASGSEPHSSNFLRNLYASILANSCNIGVTKMAHISDLSEDQLTWCNHWYLREETLKAAINTLVDFHYHQPLSKNWGGGTLSSSDGQRFPTSGKIRNAAALPRYFGYGKGVTFYTWTSDQFSQYGTKVISATMRDATYVLDEILDNETELSIVEHTTDTAGYTELVFALFDLLGMQFSPRIRDIGDQCLYRFDTSKVYPNLKPMLKGKLDRDLIIKRGDDLLRVAGSLKTGWVTASLLIGKLQAYPRQNALTRVLQEYGRLTKTIFILRYLESEEYRRRIHAQINKGENLHNLRRFIFFAHEGKIRRKQLDEQSYQALCLSLVTNAVIVWNTVYINAVIEQLKSEGYSVLESDLKHTSPAKFEHINPYGKYHFDVDRELMRKELRPLRRS